MDVTSRDYEGNDYIFVNEFINNNGRAPKHIGKPKTPEEEYENKLAKRWRHLTGTLNAAEKDYIEANLIKVEEKEIRDSIVKIVEEVNEFINNNGRKPKQIAKPKTSEEEYEYKLACRWGSFIKKLNFSRF